MRLQPGVETPGYFRVSLRDKQADAMPHYESGVASDLPPHSKLWSPPPHASMNSSNSSILIAALSSFAFTLSAFAALAEKPAGIPENFSLQYSESFDTRAALDSLVFSDPKAWRFAKDG